MIAGFQVTSAACENFAGSTGDCENQLSQLIGVKFWVFHQFDLLGTEKEDIRTHKTAIDNLYLSESIL